jgi:hypothetical protein
VGAVRIFSKGKGEEVAAHVPMGTEKLLSKLKHLSTLRLFLPITL